MLRLLHLDHPTKVRVGSSRRGTAGRLAGLLTASDAGCGVAVLAVVGEPTGNRAADIDLLRGRVGERALRSGGSARRGLDLGVVARHRTGNDGAVAADLCAGHGALLTGDTSGRTVRGLREIDVACNRLTEGGCKSEGGKNSRSQKELTHDESPVVDARSAHMGSCDTHNAQGRVPRIKVKPVKRISGWGRTCW